MCPLPYVPSCHTFTHILSPAVLSMYIYSKASVVKNDLNLHPSFIEELVVLHLIIFVYLVGLWYMLGVGVEV